MVIMLPDIYVIICDCEAFYMTPRAPILEHGIFLSYEDALQCIEAHMNVDENKKILNVNNPSNFNIIENVLNGYINN